ncbi:MAG: cobaltochelatase subunit CobN [Prochlorothrix sp.]|nr:cobaltochelatase subunit CobN [Prochlorothrix sp.]
MHRLAATPGGWDPNAEGVIFIDQSPAPIVLLTAADTDIQTLAQALPQLPADFPAVRSVNLLQLQQQLTIDTYAETVLAHAQIIMVRLLGGRGYWSYGLEVVKAVAEETGAILWVLPGDDRPDPDLVSHSTVSLRAVDRLWRYFCEGGVKNLRYGLEFVAYQGLGLGNLPPEPCIVPKVGIYTGLAGINDRSQPTNLAANPAATPPQHPEIISSQSPTQGDTSSELTAIPDCQSGISSSKSGVLVLFYRSHYLAGNTKPIDALCQALIDRGLAPLPLYVSSLRDREIQAEILALVGDADRPPLHLVLNTTGFALGTPQHAPHHASNHPPHASPSPSPSPPGFWEQLGVPVLQVILSGGTVEQWQESWQGLTPRDIAMNVALPEVDGRIITRAVSFKAIQQHQATLETDVVVYEPEPSRIHFVADLACNWVNLAQTPALHQRIALILANYPTRDGRLANGVGLDTPESCIRILQSLANAGYNLGDPAQIPATGQDLIRALTQGQTNDPESEWRSIDQCLDRDHYRDYFHTLPAPVQQGVIDRWGIRSLESSPQSPETPDFPVPGLQLGNIFIGIQPARGYDQDPSLNYHAPDLEPTPEYLAVYEWLRSQFQAQAIVHVGKHGNLEWLPGKGLALSENCYPEVALGALPHFYPFIVNDPGEGSQAKRRAQAVILDHLTPPMTRAELYGPLAQLEQWVDEYYDAQTLDPPRVPIIRQRIWDLLQQERLDQELVTLTSVSSTETAMAGAPEIWLTALDRYLCELKEAQIRDGLHVFGQCPTGEQLRDLVVAIARSPSGGRLGLTRALATDLHLNFDPLTADLGETWPIAEPKAGKLPAPLLSSLNQQAGPCPVRDFSHCRTIGDGVAALESIAAIMVAQLINTEDPEFLQHFSTLSATHTELTWIAQTLLPALHQTPQELTHLIQGLAGRYIVPGPSGAPSRGRPEVLPTGRNFYSVDLRGLPTESAWDLGQKAADAVIERYTQENGEYPQSLGLSVWGTSTMRTGGDDIAEALALLGVRPVWEGPSRRVVDFEILPLSVLGRPRVDVTLRISGFFRDAFPNLIDLFDRATQAVAQLTEAPTENPLADRVRQESQSWQKQGLTPDQAQRRASYRVFGSKPGAYGAGLQGLIEGQNWQSDADLAQAYINWSSYAYSSNPDQGRGNECQGHSAPEVFRDRLQNLQIVLHNQDNREHDLLDSDDYYQFQGGLTAAVRVTQGQQPHTYFGDHSRPEQPKVRSLPEEIARVYRSRVINPKWIAGVMRHGYKGAFEMAATLDYLFAYDATAHCAGDSMYTGISDAYVLDPTVQAFVQMHNPWALRDMAERLLEAHQRGMWQEAEPARLEQLRAIVLEAEGTIESQTH